MPVCSPGVVTAPLTKAVGPSVSQSTGLSLQEPLPAGRRWNGEFLQQRRSSASESFSPDLFLKAVRVCIYWFMYMSVCAYACAHTLGGQRRISVALPLSTFLP